ALDIHLEDGRVVNQAVDGGNGPGRVSFTEGPVGGDEVRAPLVACGDELEQGAGLGWSLVRYCRLQIFADREGRELMSHGGFVDGTITMTGVLDDDQQSLWQDKVLLNESFFRVLLEHPVPVSEAALRAIGPVNGDRRLHLACLPAAFPAAGYGHRM